MPFLDRVLILPEPLKRGVEAAEADLPETEDLFALVEEVEEEAEVVKEAEGGRWGESVGVTFMLFEFGFEARIAGDCLDFLDMAEVPPSIGESPLDGEAARLFDLWG